MEGSKAKALLLNILNKQVLGAKVTERLDH